VIGVELRWWTPIRGRCSVGPCGCPSFPMRVLEEESFPYASCNCLVGDTDDDAVELFDAIGLTGCP
jgi:hypothetical protein